MEIAVQGITKEVGSGPSLHGSSTETGAGDVSTPAPLSGPELTIVVPTFNERANVREMVRELEMALRGIRWEAIFVDDDSPDLTAGAVRELAQSDHRIRCLQRLGRRGLSTACIEGMLASSAPFLAVIDGDLQHDPKILPEMLRAMHLNEWEIVVGSRYVEGGNIGEWGAFRAFVSKTATWLGKGVVPPTLKDPMSGCFMLRRELFEEAARKLSGLGFKILVDIFASVRRPIAFGEIPIEFRNRRFGTSKLDGRVASEYLLLLVEKTTGGFLPFRFVAFSAIGLLGAGVHAAVLTVLLKMFRVDFAFSQAVATCVGMVSNYTLNNLLAYRDRRRRGFGWLAGLGSFAALCSLGAVANVEVARRLFDLGFHWLWAALAGFLVGGLWNYATTSIATWGRQR